MWNSLTSGVGMFAAKQKMNSMFGSGGDQQVDTDKSNKMRQELAEKRKERDAATGSNADRSASKGKLSAMWAENKAKNK